jgi:hypothetical protein
VKPSKRWQRDLKIVVSAIVLFGVAVERPSLAEEGHAHHAHHAGATDTAAPRSKAGIAKAIGSLDAKPADAIDSGVASPPPPSDFRRDASHDVRPGVRITKPGNFQGRRVGVPGPSNPVVRNAIGQRVIATPNATVGLKRFAPNVQTTDAIPGGTRTVAPQKSLGGPNAGLQNAAVPGSARIPSRSEIGGAAPVRSSAALSGLGGPAKPVAGINGTTLRPKH